MSQDNLQFESDTDFVIWPDSTPELNKRILCYQILYYQISMNSCAPRQL